MDQNACWAPVRVLHFLHPTPTDLRSVFSLALAFMYSSENDLLYRVEDLRKPEDSEHDIRMTDYSMSDSGVRLI